MAKAYKLSQERLDKLQDELTYLKTVREREIADMIKEARSFGDLSENSEYEEAKNEQGKLYARIDQLEEMLSNYEVIEDLSEDDILDTVKLGSTITVLDVEFQETETYQVVGSQEADPMNGRISEESPFGQAFLEQTVGSDVIVDSPSGPIHYQILDIAR